jgi:peptidoglycan/xylan/chitin deacetylase (PgdA/CDA1 family)
MSGEKKIKTLSFRFDIDGIGDVKRGISPLLSLADSFGVKFSFYVNMGKSANLKFYLIDLLRKILNKEKNNKNESNKTLKKATALLKKHGIIGSFKTLLYNPYIGVKYKRYLFEVQEKGHELGLHGGMDHALWLYNLEGLSARELENLIVSAYKRFNKLYGKPYGFCSPGLKYNDKVFDLLNELKFLYVSEKLPFKTNNDWDFCQIPVNIMGKDDRSFISYGLLQGWSEKDIEKKIIGMIEKEKEPAVYYGHPSIEGRKGIDILGNVIQYFQHKGYRIITLKKLVSLKMEKIYAK